ncbi:carbohydrate binding domain-containing protein [Niveibacterium terrae]|uniref:carbohydrate binding domain-containing protein n=1 Tax=Niveibacterium terrae TaxID=3373598 RepID=UPI003A93A773
MHYRLKPIAACVAALLAFTPQLGETASIPAAHVYHNHMPNFWPFYGVDVTATYNATAVGSPIRYMYDGQVINLKNSPPSGYSYYLPSALGGAIMPHDDLVTYYTPDAKTGAYQWWPQTVASELSTASGGSGQIHVTMSGAVINNVNSLENLQNVAGYTNPSWGTSWTNSFNSLKTTNGYRGLDTIHFTGHHSMGPLVGQDYFLKDLIYQNATLAQSYFLGSSFVSSKGFFPTELGFSERLIPTLAKLGVQWAVMGNNHFSRTLKDYPYSTYDPTGDTLTSPPNRADLQNSSTIGSWVANGMAHEQQVIVNKFPFASTPHYVRYVDPTTGAVSQIAGIPVSQNGSWAEGWDGSTTVDEYVPYTGLESRQFFVVAHDGDNSGGRAGSLDTWRAGYNTTCTGNGYCQGIDEYLKAHPIPTSDVQHVQDGSWVDTRDSSSDPTWYHWHLPFMIWSGQFSAFNTATGLNLAPKKTLKGVAEGATVSFEYGWHYLERNFALLQAALNYAKTAEQIWLDAHPSYWSPSTTADKQVTYSGNQLNPWMISYPVKGDASKDYVGGANPAELAWYFLLPAMDSGFGYYDENKDDDVKPTLAFNNSLAFAKPYVAANLANDKTGPSVWWPQRYPYNPGSVNGSKAEGWSIQHYSNDFAIYTYGYDVSGIASAKVMVRTHASNNIDASDDTYKVYDPAALAGKAGLSITPANVGAWTAYPMQVRDLKPVMNGVDWNANVKATMQVLPAQEIGNLYYSYISAYRNQLLDYYVEMTDTKGNVSKSEIQQVYVGAGTYTATSSGSGFVEDVNGTVKGVYPFLVSDTTPPSVPGTPLAGTTTDTSVALSWTASTDNIAVTGYEIYRNGTLVGTSTTNSYSDSGLSASTAYTYQVLAYDAAGNKSAKSASLTATTLPPDTIAPTVPGNPVSTATTASSTTLGWTASTDNYALAGYRVYRDGALVATVKTLSYTDTALTPATTYSYTVLAFDAAGNASAVSAATKVTTLNGNVATVFYKVPTTWSSVYLHYAPTGGTWTTVPGVAMSSACSGWNSYTVNLGSATGLAAAFNNGSGTWDNNSSKNYSLGIGISAISGGAVTTGANPCPVDPTPPTVPTNLAATSNTASSVTLGWTASTDNVAVTGYKILRNGTQIGTSTTASYTDGTVAAGTSYSYTVIAYDAAGNVSAASSALTLKTPPGNSATVYYKPASSWSSVNIHYGINGSWTTSPGEAMTLACTGWYAKTIALGSYTALAATFNNGSGTWDNNSSKNYSLSTGISSVSGGAITTGVSPCVPDTTPPSTPDGLVKGTVSSTSVALNWTASTDDVAVTGYKVLRDGTQIGVSTTASYTDGTAVAGKTYSYTVIAYDAAGNVSSASTALSVTTPICSTVSVSFTIANANTVTGQNLYVVGNQTALGNWTPASGFALTIQGSGANVPWTGTVSLPLGTAVQYKYVKWNGSTPVWETNQSTTSGNRELTTSSTCGAQTAADGNFKF